MDEKIAEVKKKVCNMFCKKHGKPYFKAKNKIWMKIFLIKERKIIADDVRS
jgi:hypothetical protein